MRQHAAEGNEGRVDATNLSSMKTSLCVVVPCYNAGERLRPVVEKVLNQSLRIVVVDDGSTDEGIELLGDLPVQLVQLAHNQGKGHALLAGFREALSHESVQCVCMLDADGQHDPTEIPRLYTAYTEMQADLVIGTRSFSGQRVPFRSRFGNTVTAWITGVLLGRRLPDTQCGFRLLSRPFAQLVCDTIAGGRYEMEMEMLIRAVRGGYTVASVPIATRYEPGNKSSHFNKLGDSARIYWRLLRILFRS